MESMTSIASMLEGGSNALTIREHVAELISSGVGRDAILEGLDGLRAELRTGGQDAAEDTILEVMDFLVGFSGPHMRL
jgi:hypothetical protein